MPACPLAYARIAGANFSHPQGMRQDGEAKRVTGIGCQVPEKQVMGVGCQVSVRKAETRHLAPGTSFSHFDFVEDCFVAVQDLADVPVLAGSAARHLADAGGAHVVSHHGKIRVAELALERPEVA